MKSLRSWYVKYIYADHNSSKALTRALNSFLDSGGTNALVLNVGSGTGRLRPNVRNLDIIEGADVDYVGPAEDMPLGDETVDLIVTQEAFEHIMNPDQALAECYRVLKPGGSIFFQVPFIIGYHPGPTDYLRFTREGVEEILSRAGFKINSIQISVAGATGFYRIAVEFFAILFSGPISPLYRPMKAIFALSLYPIKLLDPWFRITAERDRIPGGYFTIAHKHQRQTNKS